MGISYIEMNEQKIPIEDEELRGVVPKMQGAIDECVRTLGYVKTKNLLPNNTKSVVNLGLTFTYNSDGTVTVNGTATDDYWYDLCHRITSPITLKKNSYILSGCANGGSDSGYYMGVIKTVNGSGEEIAKDYGNGVSFTLNEDTNVGTFIFVKKGTTVNNLVFKPMIRLAYIEDDTYEPYVEDVKTYMDNHNITSREKLLEENYSASISTQTINIPNYHAYNMLSIRIQGDVNNGIRLNIPKVLYDSPTPFYIDAKNKNDSGYTFKAQGSFANGSLIINYSTIAGWAKFNVLVLGLK